jgi:4,5-DOPA dioxygenase extradiol
VPVEASSVPSPTPALFVSHGAPTAALDDDDFTRALAEWAQALSRPRAIVILSAHSEARGPIRVNAAARPPLVYDFYGFSDELYALRYPAPGSPALADDVLARLTAASIEAQRDEASGWDHGVWVPLRLAFPAADVPIVSLSLPVPRTSELLLRCGRALAPLREEGVLLVGSGGIVHNLRQLRWAAGDAPEPWAAAFDGWVRERLDTLDVDGLRSYGLAPEAELAVPSSEHFDPVFFVLGSRAPGERVSEVYAGFRYGSLSLRSFALSSP